MIGKVPPKPLKPGDELVCKWLNEVREAAVSGGIAALGPGLKGSPTPTGWAINLANPLGQMPGFLAKTDGAITARSGTTLGGGDVFLTSISGTTITVETDTVDVLNFSSTTGGIPDATYVWVEQDADGNYFITSVDCGN